MRRQSWLRMRLRSRRWWRRRLCACQMHLLPRRRWLLHPRFRRRCCQRSPGCPPRGEKAFDDQVHRPIPKYLEFIVSKPGQDYSMN
jgi:hypothetical protein